MKFISKILIGLSLLTVFTLSTVHAETESVNESTAADHLPAHLIYESSDLDAFTEIKLELVSSYVEIQAGDVFQINVFASQEDTTFDDLFNLSTKGQKLVLNEKDWKNNLKSFITTLTSRVVITVPETEKVSVKIDLVNGEVNVKGSLAKFEFDGPNGDLFLSGKETYPMAIDIVNGDIELVFETFDANLDFEFVNGSFDLMGDTISAMFSDLKRTYGNGRDNIQIDAVNGKVVLIEAE